MKETLTSLFHTGDAQASIYRKVVNGEGYL